MSAATVAPFLRRVDWPSGRRIPLSQASQDPSAADLAGLLERGLASDDFGWSRSGRMIASYLRDNWQNLAFETGASIAGQLELSEMTVIRFIRQLGFANLRDFKEALKTAEPPRGRDASGTPARPSPTPPEDPLARQLQGEIRALEGVHRLQSKPFWTLATELLAASECLSICGFQSGAGLARDLAARLHRLRPQVRVIDAGPTGASEILDMVGRSHCLLLIESRPHDGQTEALAHWARARGIAVILVTDGPGDWAQGLTEMVLSAEIEGGDDLSLPLGVLAALNLLLGATAKRLGPAAIERQAVLAATEAHFSESPTRPAPRAPVTRTSPVPHPFSGALRSGYGQPPVGTQIAPLAVPMEETRPAPISAQAPEPQVLEPFTERATEPRTEPRPAQAPEPQPRDSRPPRQSSLDF